MNELPTHCFSLNGVSMDGACQYCVRKLLDTIARITSENAAKDKALGMAVEAMERSVAEGFTDHLDDGGEFWYAALTACREAMGGA